MRIGLISDTHGLLRPEAFDVLRGSQLIRLCGLDIDPAAAGHRAVIFGHSHKPLVEKRGDVVFVNPGSAGTRRFRLPVGVARMNVRRGKIEVELLSLDV